MDIINTSPTLEILRQNKFQMSVLDILVLKQDVDKKLTMNTISCSLLESSSTSDDNEMDNGVYKSTVLEPIKNT